MTKRELKQIFGVEHHSQVPDYKLVKAEKQIVGDGELLLSFDAWNTSYRLELIPNRRLISPHLVI